MILVDSSVWINFFKGVSNRETELLKNYIRNNEDLCVCGVILTEVLMGARLDSIYNELENYFDNLVYLTDNKEIYRVAASIYRSSKKTGKTIRSTVDCVIASIAIVNNIPLLENDRDFKVISKVSKLRLL